MSGPENRGVGRRRCRPLLFVAALAFALPAAADDWRHRFGEQWPRTDFNRTTVPLSELRSGGPPKDAIPAIDEPAFVTLEDARQWLDAREPVVAVEVDGRARAYPLQILIWHEIVNDRVGGVPVAVTFCPLCNAAIVFDRRLDGEMLDFGTTGKLRHSDLVMYDRQTESWWQQFTGDAIAGRHAGRELGRLPAPIVAFEDFAVAYPTGRVLSRQTGHQRDYGRNPYRGYDRVGQQPFLLKGSPDPRLPAMERVLGVILNGESRIYPLSTLVGAAPVNDTMAGTPVVVFARPGTLSALDAERIRESRQVPTAAAYDRTLDGRTLTFEGDGGRLRDLQTGSSWNIFGHAVAGPLAGRRLEPVDAGVHFAFAWLVFRPDSEVADPG